MLSVHTRARSSRMQMRLSSAGADGTPPTQRRPTTPPVLISRYVATVASQFRKGPFQMDHWNADVVRLRIYHDARFINSHRTHVPAPRRQHRPAINNSQSSDRLPRSDFSINLFPPYHSITYWKDLNNTPSFDYYLIWLTTLHGWNYHFINSNKV